MLNKRKLMKGKTLNFLEWKRTIYLYIDLLEPSRNEDMNTFVANDDGTDDLDEDEIIAEEKSNEEDVTASNQMESDKMKEEGFVEKSEEEKIKGTLP